MDVWRVVALGVLKQGLGCDYDRLQEFANHHGTVRQMLEVYLELIYTYQRSTCLSILLSLTFATTSDVFSSS